MSRGLRDFAITPSKMSGALNSWRKTATSWRENACNVYVDEGSPISVLEGRCPAEFSSNPNQTHLKQPNKILLGTLEASMQVCWGKLELNSAGHRPPPGPNLVTPDADGRHAAGGWIQWVSVYLIHSHVPNFTQVLFQILCQLHWRITRPIFLIGHHLERNWSILRKKWNNCTASRKLDDR